MPRSADCAGGPRPGSCPSDDHIDLGKIAGACGFEDDGIFCYTLIPWPYSEDQAVRKSGYNVNPPSTKIVCPVM